MSKKSTKQRKKQIDGGQRQIELHRQKIEDELKRPAPYHPLIEHWRREIEQWEKQNESRRQKLPGKSR